MVEGDIPAGVDMSMGVGVLMTVGEGFTTVVLCSMGVLGDAAGATVSVRCSHAARSDALASIHRYFFIVMDWVA